jgi:hypothetical protein
MFSRFAVDKFVLEADFEIVLCNLCLLRNYDVVFMLVLLFVID